MADLTLRAQYEEAVRLVHCGELARAVAVCRRILETFPRHIGTYSVLGQVLLEVDEHEEAANLFRRVLSADPEHTLAYVSIGAIYEERGLIEEAIWQFERAIELSPGNEEIRQELRRLYRERGWPGSARLKMTRAALARTYLRGRLYPKAIGEIKALVADETYRFDLRVALAEALWHDDRHKSAEAVCQGILPDLPNCLKANLILGQIWLNTENDQKARRFLQRAQALDPENATAQAMFGAFSPLAPRIARLPFREEDAPPIELPYLVDDAGVTVEGVTIEGVADTLQLHDGLTNVPGKGKGSEEGVGEPLGQTEESLVLEGYSILDAAPEKDATVPARVEPADRLAVPDRGEEVPRESQAQPVGPKEMSVLDLQRRHVEENPGDYPARLALARRLRDIGDIDHAIEEYEYLVDRDQMLPTVTQDIELLNTLHPGNAALVALFVEADERGPRLLLNPE